MSRHRRAVEPARVEEMGIPDEYFRVTAAAEKTVRLKTRFPFFFFFGFFVIGKKKKVRFGWGTTGRVKVYVGTNGLWTKLTLAAWGHTVLFKWYPVCYYSLFWHRFRVVRWQMGFTSIMIRARRRAVDTIIVNLMNSSIDFFFKNGKFSSRLQNFILMIRSVNR